MIQIMTRMQVFKELFHPTETTYEGIPLEEGCYGDFPSVHEQEEGHSEDGCTPALHHQQGCAFLFWSIMQCLATVTLVWSSKRVFVAPGTMGAPTLLVAYHFALTAVMLHTASTVGALQRALVPWIDVLLLSLLLAGQTVVTNWSLALLDIAIYQELQILLAPVVAILAFYTRRQHLGGGPIAALAIVCLGVGMTLQSATLRAYNSEALDAKVRNLYLGYSAGLVGVLLGAISTVGLAVYLPKLQITSLQLLHRLAPAACIILLVLAPFSDTSPAWSTISRGEWAMIGLSGVSVVLMNLSHFLTEAQTLPDDNLTMSQGTASMIVVVGVHTKPRHISLLSAGGVAATLVGVVAHWWLTKRRGLC
jgi:solute carrier family 35 protein E3